MWRVDSKGLSWIQGNHSRGCYGSFERKDDGSEGGEKGPGLLDGLAVSSKERMGEHGSKMMLGFLLEP